MQQSQVTTAVIELTARPEGASVREIMAASGGERKAVQASLWRRSLAGEMFVRKGVDGHGLYCHRYFFTQAAADAYVFVSGRYEQTSDRIETARDFYLKHIAQGPVAPTELAARIKRNHASMTRTLSRMVQLGMIFRAKRIDPATKRPTLVMFVSEQARDEWAAANPYTLVGRTPREPKPRIEKPKKADTRNCKKSTKRSALSPTKRLDKGVAQILAGRSRKAFEAPPKPPEYKLTKEDLEKVVKIPSHPGYDPRYQCPPNERVVGGFASMKPGQYLDGVAA